MTMKSQRAFRKLMRSGATGLCCSHEPGSASSMLRTGSVLRLSKLLVVEQLREPVGLFWSFLAPPLLFAFLTANQGGSIEGSVGRYQFKAGWFVSYIAVTISLFS